MTISVLFTLQCNECNKKLTMTSILSSYIERASPIWLPPEWEEIDGKHYCELHRIIKEKINYWEEEKEGE